MNIYRGFPQRLHHRVPDWVEDGALFHIRIRLDRDGKQRPLIDSQLAQAVLDSARFYEQTRRWHMALFLLMPDHLHALLAFERDQSMSEIIRDWKRFHALKNHILWQEGTLITVCATMNAASNYRRKQITFDKIQLLRAYVQESKIGLGLLTTCKDGEGGSARPLAKAFGAPKTMLNRCAFGA